MGETTRRGVIFLFSLLMQPAVSAAQQPISPPKTPQLAAKARPAPKPNPAKDITMGEFRKKYLGQRILILEGHDIDGSIGEWEPMKLAGREVVQFQGVLREIDSFENDFSKGAFIKFAYKEETPTIIAIEKSTGGGLYHPKEGQSNILGESLSDDDEVNPYVDVFVRFDDGQIARYSNYANQITGYIARAADPDEDRWDVPFITVSDRDSHAAIINQNLPNTIGQKLFAIYDSLVLDVDTTPAELLDVGKRYEKALRDIPLLVPMTIVGAKYNDRYDFIAWKLRLPNGREIISAARYRESGDSKYGNDNSFLGRCAGTLLLKIPPKLTPREIAAIRTRKVFRAECRSRRSSIRGESRRKTTTDALAISWFTENISTYILTAREELPIGKA